MNHETADRDEMNPTADGRIWPKLSILLIGGAALGLIVLMCVIVALVAIARG